jgi:flagellar biosynthesis protein FlhG
MAQLDSLKSWSPSVPPPLSAGGVAPSLAIASGKGGVGKSHISLALGMAFADQGRRVLLVDGDMGLANLHILCGKHPERDLSDVLAGRCTPSEALLRLEDRLDLLPAASGVSALANLPREDVARLGRGLEQVESEADLLVVDTGAGIGDTTLNLVLASDRLLLVTTPEPTAQADAYALLKVLRSRKADFQASVVVNLADSEAQAREAAARLDQVASRFLSCSLPFAGWIPREPGLERHLLRREPAYRAAPRSPFSSAIRSLAGALAKDLPRPTGGSFLGRVTTSTTFGAAP